MTIITKAATIRITRTYQRELYKHYVQVRDKRGKSVFDIRHMLNLEDEIKWIRNHKPITNRIPKSLRKTINGEYKETWTPKVTYYDAPSN